MPGGQFEGKLSAIFLKTGTSTFVKSIYYRFEARQEIWELNLFEDCREIRDLDLREGPGKINFGNEVIHLRITVPIGAR